MPLTNDPLRTQRILYDIIIDAYDEGEQLMSWYYFIGTMEFPTPYPLRSGKTETQKVKIVEVDKRSEQEQPNRLGIIEPAGNRVQFISPQDIISTKTTPKNLEIPNDWLYWHIFALICHHPSPLPS